MKRSVVVVAILLHAASASALTCMAAKERAAAKKIARKMGCHATAKGAGTTVDGACLAKAEAKFAAAIAPIEGGCPGDEATLEAVVDPCVDALAANIPGDGPCQKKSARSLGQWAKRLVGCAAKDSADPGSFAACDGAADAKGAAALSKAGGCASTDTHADLHAECVEALVAALQPPTTTSTTSTTTTTLACCDPACDSGDTCVFTFMAGQISCGCIPPSLCSQARCAVQASCGDFDLGCPPGYSCFDHSFCIGSPCDGSGGFCGCPPSETCYLGLP